MKRIYNKLIEFFMNFVVKLEKFKTKTFEKIAINKKKKIYKNVKWTTEQQKAFDEYWLKYYGKKIPNKWHKLYEYYNGVFNVEYMPEIIFSTRIEPTLNNYYQVKVYADKNINDVLFNNRIDGVRTPKTYLSNSFGQFYDGERKLISREHAIDILYSLGTAVIKPTIDSSSGRNVAIINMQNGINQKTGETVDRLIDKYKTNFIVQEKIIPNAQLEKLYPKSINTVRIISYLLDDKIETCPVSLRIGGGGSEIDNIHAGGMSIAVSNEGLLAEKAYRLGYGDKTETFDKHPDTEVQFKDYKLDFVERMIDTAKKLHIYTAGIGLISWDFTINDKDEIIVIEANYKGQSSWFPQMLSGKALFGENTQRILKRIKK